MRREFEKTVINKIVIYNGADIFEEFISRSAIDHFSRTTVERRNIQNAATGERAIIDDLTVRSSKVTQSSVGRPGGIEPEGTIIY